MVSRPPGKQFGMKGELLSELHLDNDKYVNACQQLGDFNLIKYKSSTGELWGYIGPTDEGRLATRRNFRDPQVSNPLIQTGPIFNGSVTSQNFQAFTSAINSQLEQSIVENDPALLKAQASEIIELLVNQTSTELPLDKKAIYTQAALD